MTDENDQEQVQEQEQPDAGAETPPVEKRPGRAIGLIAVLLSLIALASAGGGLYLLQQFRASAGGREAELAQLHSQLQGLQRSIASLQGQREALSDSVKKLTDRQETMQQSIKKLYESQNRHTIDWALDEIEHLMIIAVHSLTLQKDVKTALAALKAADVRIRDLGDPSLLPVRRQVVSDINALRSVNQVDISGLSLFLADAVGRVDDLPLTKAATATGSEKHVKAVDQNLPAWERVLMGVWQEIKGLVVITRTSQAGAALLLPEEKYFLYQNLRLQLESARAAVFRRDTANFHASIDIALKWLQKYFDTNDAAVSNIMQSLRGMKKLDLEQKLPDISSSLESLHAYMKQHAEGSSSGGQQDSASP
jgi:uroporphyrin-3 C-methyltransferase